MPSKIFPSAQANRLSNFATLALLLLLPALATRCTTEDPASPPVVVPVDSTIQILSPAAPASFKLTDNFTMIVKCDYTQFTSGLNFQISLDSAKNWSLMLSLPRKEGVALDTLHWDPLLDSPGSIPAGKPALIRVIDYNKRHYTISKYFTFTN